jgi:hypothetical protein
VKQLPSRLFEHCAQDHEHAAAAVESSHRLQLFGVVDILKATWGLLYLAVLFVVCVDDDQREKLKTLLVAIERLAPMTASHPFILRA